MKKFSNVLLAGVLGVSLSLAACSSSLVISDVDYAQPVETVLTPNGNGQVHDVRNGLSFNILPLQMAETGNDSTIAVNQVRMIRGAEGYYYITASGFKHVYVMAPSKSELRLKTKIKVSEEGLAQPAFNQRDKYIQLLNRATNEVFTLDAEGVQNKQSSEKEVG